MVEQFLKQVDSLKDQQNRSTVNNNDSEVANVLADLKPTAKNPVFFVAPHHPFSEYKDIIPPMLGCQAPESMFGDDRIVMALESEVKIREAAKGIETEGEETGHLGTDCVTMDIRSILQNMHSDVRQALCVMLDEVQRTRKMPDMNTDTYIWHELCGDICDILVRGIDTDQSLPLSMFTKNLTYWCKNLAATTPEDVEKGAELREKKKEEQEHAAKANDDESDSEVKTYLGEEHERMTWWKTKKPQWKKPQPKKPQQKTFNPK